MSEDLASVRDAVEHAVRVGRLEPHQLAALSKHDEGLTLAQRQEFTEGWRAKGSPAEPAHTNPLRVPYYSQRDSGTRHANRMCFSSACAMMLEGMKPGTLPGPNGDDAYLGRVFRYGDTINSESQAKALASYGVTAILKKNCTVDDIKAQIDRGISAPLGCIHKGNLQNLYGDGHWINAIGYDRTGFIVHDPFGEMDVINGGYINSNGKALRYSFKNFCRRWEVVQAGSSYRYAPGNGWAMIAQPVA
jgi:hypothetical protein